MNVRMRKVLFLLSALVFVFNTTCPAKERVEDEMLSVISLSSMSTTQKKVTTALGMPGKIEESKKRIWWYYSKGTTSLVISWNKATLMPEKFSFTSTCDSKSNFDRSLSRKLQSGKTDIAQAIAILGTPKDMTIKASKQEMYYSYQNKMLRLFFRDHKLVDYCLY